MLNKIVRPSSLVGIKRTAKDLKKAYGLPHAEALDAAAKLGSFENYQHARRQLTQKHRFFLTIYWDDRKARSWGREILEIELSKPVLELASKSELKIVPALCWMRLAADDHLVYDTIVPSQDFARREVSMAARELCFMEGTGLKPLRARYQVLPGQEKKNKPPHYDHPTQWYDPDTGQEILVYEPYQNAELDDEDHAWASEHSWHLRVSQWPGKYFPYNCGVFVAADASGNYNIDDLIKKIDALPAPILEEEWKGQSAKTHSPFYSPLAKTPQDKRRAKAKDTVPRFSSKKTIPYAGNKRRPNSTLPVAKHLELGKAIKGVYRSEISWAVHQRVNRVRSELENWLIAEHPDSEIMAHGADALDVYYGHADLDGPGFSIRENIKTLKAVKKELCRAYNDCAPLRALVKKLDVALSCLEKAATRAQ